MNEFEEVHDFLKSSTKEAKLEKTPEEMEIFYKKWRYSTSLLICGSQILMEKDILMIGLHKMTLIVIMEPHENKF